MLTDFMHAAFPWIVIGISLAVIFVNNPKKENSYSSQGMFFGMCVGILFSNMMSYNIGIGIGMGMLAGIAIGSCIPKKEKE